LAVDVSVAFVRRGRFIAFGSITVVVGPASARGKAQAGTNCVASNSTWRTIVLGRSTGGPTGARSGSIGARTAGGSLFGDRSGRVKRPPRKGSRPKPRRILRAWDPARPMYVASPSDSTRTFVIEEIEHRTRDAFDRLYASIAGPNYARPKTLTSGSGTNHFLIPPDHEAIDQHSAAAGIDLDCQRPRTRA
jgi:hypothetical protein